MRVIKGFLTKSWIINFYDFHTAALQKTTMNLLQGQSSWSNLRLSAFLKGAVVTAQDLPLERFKPANLRSPTLIFNH